MYVTIPATPDTPDTPGTAGIPGGRDGDPNGSALHVVALHVTSGRGWPTGPRYVPGQSVNLPVGSVLISSHRRTGADGTDWDQHTMHVLDPDHGWICPAPSAITRLRPHEPWPAAFLAEITAALTDPDTDTDTDTDTNTNSDPAPFATLDTTGMYRRGQGWAQDTTLRHHTGVRVRCRIYRDFYDHQSHATTQMWTATGWTTVVDRDPATWPLGAPSGTSREEDVIRRYAAALEADLLAATDTILHP